MNELVDVKNVCILVRDDVHPVPVVAQGELLRRLGGAAESRAVAPRPPPRHGSNKNLSFSKISGFSSDP